MIKIGIDLNHVVRDVNSQIIKYYKKDIDPTFDESNMDIYDTDLIKKLPFNSKKDRDNFLYVDYPFEIFGCAKPMGRNLINSIINWENNILNKNDENYQIIHFSSNEIALTIQSTFYFLSKVGSRVREVYFPKNSGKIWDVCDIVITANPKIINSKPENKFGVFIKYDKLLNDISRANLVYDSLDDVLQDQSFIEKTKLYKPKTISEKIKNKIKKIFKYGFK